MDRPLLRRRCKEHTANRMVERRTVAVAQRDGELLTKGAQPRGLDRHQWRQRRCRRRPFEVALLRVKQLRTAVVGLHEAREVPVAIFMLDLLELARVHEPH